MCVRKYLIVFVVILFALENKVACSPSARIVGGYEAPPEFGRFHASLQNRTGTHICGGAVISKSHVVTAAHCLEVAEPQHIKVVVGTTNLDNGGQQFDVVSLVMHEQYNVITLINDIAIVKINGVFDDNIIEIDANQLNEGDPVVITGFGTRVLYGETSRLMYALEVLVFNQETCEYAMWHKREVIDTMFCTFSRFGEGICHGDSGGPLIKNNKLVGLVSWGEPCALGFPDVHTRISPYIEWINNIIEYL